MRSKTAGILFVLTMALPLAWAAEKISYRPVNFDWLGGSRMESPYQRKTAASQEAPTNQRVPEQIIALSGKKVAVHGFMVPLEAPGAQVTTFILVRDRSSCCFGGPPKLTHRIFVTMEEGRHADFYPDNVVVAKGTFKVTQTVVDEDTTILYEMTADEVARDE